MAADSQNGLGGGWIPGNVEIATSGVLLTHGVGVERKRKGRSSSETPVSGLIHWYMGGQAKGTRPANRRPGAIGTRAPKS